MKKFAIAYFWALLTLHVCHSADYPWKSIVRLPRQGVSGVVIFSTAGNTYILTAAHGFHGKQARARIIIQVPAGSSSARANTRPRLVAIDYRADLALIHVSAGPIAPALPIAENAIAAPGQELLSMGYTFPGTSLSWEWVKVTRPFPGLRRRQAFAAIHTTGFPAAGRSGGALIDARTGKLVGIINSRLWNDRGQTGGMYVSTLEVNHFLKNRLPTSVLVNGYTAGRPRNASKGQIQNRVLVEIGRNRPC